MVFRYNGIPGSALRIVVLVLNNDILRVLRLYFFVLEGDDIIVMGVHILVGGVVLPRASGVAPSLKGHIAVVVVPHGHKVFHVVNVVFRYNGIPGSALRIVVLMLDNDILRVFFLDVGNRLQRSAVQLGDLAVGNPDGNGLQRLIAVHLVLDQSILKAGGEPLNAYRAIFVGNTGKLGSVNSKAGAGQSVAVLIHLCEAQVAEVALHRRNGEVHGVRILRDDRIILHLREEVVGKGSSAVGGIRLPSLKALCRRVQGDGVGQSVGVSSSVACFGNFRRAALQVPAKDTVCIGETVVICRRIRSRTGVLDELSHGVGDVPRLCAQSDQLCDVVELNGQVVCIGSGKALGGEAVHPVGNVCLHPVRLPITMLPHAVYHLPVILALFSAVIFVEYRPMLSFRLNEAPIFKIGFSGLERHGVKVDICRGDGRSQSLNGLPVNVIRNVSAALLALDFCKAVAGVRLHMEGGAAVRHQDNIDVFHVFQEAVLAFFAVDQIVGQLQTAFHVGAAVVSALIADSIDGVFQGSRLVSRYIRPAADDLGVRAELDDCRIPTLRDALALNVIVKEVLGRRPGCFHPDGIFFLFSGLGRHAVGRIHDQDHRRVRRSGDLLQLLSRGHLQGNLKFVFRAGFPNGLADRYVVFIGFRKTVGHDLTGGRNRLFDSCSNDRTGEYAAGENRCTEDASNRFAQHGDFLSHSDSPFP